MKCDSCEYATAPCKRPAKVRVRCLQWIPCCRVNVGVCCELHSVNTPKRRKSYGWQYAKVRTRPHVNGTYVSSPHTLSVCVSVSLYPAIYPSILLALSLSALSLYLLQEGMTYCAKDVQATFEVFQEVFPKMMEHAAHPCSLAGVLQMGSCYLPVDTGWQRYINRVRDVCG